MPDHGSLAVTGHHDGLLRIWDLAQLTSVGTPLAGHAGPVTALAAAHPADQIVLVSGGADRTLRTWDLTGLVTIQGSEMAPDPWRSRSCPLLRGDGSAAHDGPVTAVATTGWNGHQVIVSGSNTTLHVWDLLEREFIRPPRELLTHPVTALAVADVGGDLLGVLGSDGGGVAYVVDLDNGKRIWELSGHTRPVNAVVIAESADGSAIAFTASSDHTVRAWDIREGTPITDALPLPGPPRSLAAFDSPYGPGLIVGGSGVLAALQLRSA